MRSKEIQGIINNLIKLNNYKNPLRNFSLKKIEANLITGKIQTESQTIKEFLQDKISWFKEQIEKAEGNLKDFKKAKIIIDKQKEKIEIGYKNKKFIAEKDY